MPANHATIEKVWESYVRRGAQDEQAKRLSLQSILRYLETSGYQLPFHNLETRQSRARLLPSIDISLFGSMIFLCTNSTSSMSRIIIP
jgi:alpha-D-ribose 1-methylphosphonate 5-phosphate C-P lyase